jgi:hypothetical protein
VLDPGLSGDRSASTSRVFLAENVAARIGGRIGRAGVGGAGGARGANLRARRSSATRSDSRFRSDGESTPSASRRGGVKVRKAPVSTEAAEKRGVKRERPALRSQVVTCASAIAAAVRAEREQEKVERALGGRMSVGRADACLK